MPPLSAAARSPVAWQARMIMLCRSKTVWGAVFAAGAEMLGQPHIGWREVLRALGEVLIAIGARDALAKHAATLHAESE